MIKNWFKWRKAKKGSVQKESCNIQNDVRKSQLCATTAYQTVTRPRVRGPRSCPADLCDGEDDTYCCGTLECPFDSDVHLVHGTDYRHRRQQQQFQRFRRAKASTSEYGSGDPSPTTLYSIYSHNLDDSDSDSWTTEYQRKQHIRKLESKLREQKKKLKDYRERLRAERDLRIVNERSMMEEVEKYKRELRKEQREKNTIEQRYAEVITYMKIRLSLLEHHQPVVTQRCPPPPAPIFSESTRNLRNTVAPTPLPPSKHGNNGELVYPLTVGISSPIIPTIGNCYDQELDETKNFRAEEEVFGEVETARGSEATTTTGTEPLNDTRLSCTMLKNDSSDSEDNGYVTSCEYFQRTIQNNENMKIITGPIHTSL